MEQTVFRKTKKESRILARASTRAALACRAKGAITLHPRFLLPTCKLFTCLSRQRRNDSSAQGNVLGTRSKHIFPALKRRHSLGRNVNTRATLGITPEVMLKHQRLSARLREQPDGGLFDELVFGIAPHFHYVVYYVVSAILPSFRSSAISRPGQCQAT